MHYHSYNYQVQGQRLLHRAKRVLNVDSNHRVHEDFTDRVRQHRREFSRRLVQARNNGQYTTLNFDKLIIENTVYGYDEENQDTYTIGPVRRQPGTRFHERRRRMRGNRVGNNRDINEQQRAVVGEDNPENDVVD